MMKNFGTILLVAAGAMILPQNNYSQCNKGPCCSKSSKCPGDMPVFRNISSAEDRHTNAVKSLIDKYKLDDPASNHKSGKYQNPHLQETFNKLVEQGRESYAGTVVTGLTIEDLDIADLEKALANEIDNEDISMVYQNLLRASKNHLRAFSFHAEKNKIDYMPRYISEEAYLEINQSP